MERIYCTMDGGTQGKATRGTMGDGTQGKATRGTMGGGCG